MRRKNKDETDIRALFESGTPLDFAWIEFSRGMDRFALQALRMHPENDEDLQEADAERYEQLARGWLPKTSESRQKKLELRTHDERANLLYGIYYGDFWALGFRTLEDGSDELVRVPRQYFFVDYDREEPFPDIDWNKGELRVGNESFFDLHVVRPSEEEQEPIGGSDEQIPSSYKVEPESLVGGQPGRPSKGDVILAAIADHAKTDPDLSRPKRERFRSYRAHIAERKYDPDNDSGFSDKTIEKYETLFRKGSR